MNSAHCLLARQVCSSGRMIDSVRAVVLESTGKDSSVLHGSELEAELLEGVLGREQFTPGASR